MAEVFNKQFSSVFTAAEKFFKGPSEEKLVDIKITAQLVQKNCRGFGQTSPQEPMICHRGY